jgi:hypothetical protein
MTAKASEIRVTRLIVIPSGCLRTVFLMDTFMRLLVLWLEPGHHRG